MPTETQQTDGAGVATAAETLTVTDNRTGKQYEIPIEDETIRATELRKIKVHDDDFGLMSYDPAYMATASCRSAIRSEEHTSELQSLTNLVCRLLLEKN